MFTLFAAKGTVAVATHIALEETGLPYTLNWISFADGDQRKSEYLAINPKGRVPALVTDEGVITETPAILEFIAEAAGQLMPKDPFARAKTREMLSYCASTFHVNHAHKLRGSRWADLEASHADMTAKSTQTMAASCAYIEDQLTGGWVTEAYSIADIHLYTICRWLRGDGVDIADFPKLNFHFSQMQARPAVARVNDAHG